MRAATNEVVSGEELGGATLHCKHSGVADHFASNETEAFALGRDLISNLALEAPTAAPAAWRMFSRGRGGRRAEIDLPLYDAEDLLGLAPANARTAAAAGGVDMKGILARILDGSRLTQHKEMYAPNLITGWAHLEGHPVGIVANNGPLDAAAVRRPRGGAQWRVCVCVFVCVCVCVCVYTST